MRVNNRSELIVFSKTQLIFVVAGFLLCTLASVFFLQPAINSHYQAHLGNVVANNLQLRVNQRQDQLLAQAKRVATSIRLSELVSNGNVTQRALEEARLRETIPHAVRVRLIGLKEATVEREAIPPFTFTSLDLVNRVETGESVFPEAANANGRWLISVAAPIKSPPDPRVTGTLFIYLEISALGDIFGDELQGQVTIHQTFRNTEPSAIFIHGSGGFNLVLERPLDNPNWHVSYKPNVELMDQPTGHALFYLAPGLLFLLIATIGVLIGARKSISLVEADSALLQRQMDDVSNGTGDTRARYGLHAFLELDASLTKLRQKQTVPVAVTPPDINLDALTCEQDTTSGSNVEKRDIEAKEIPVVEHEGSIVEEVTDSEYFDTDKKESTEDGLATIFRAYDIRGIINQTLTTEVIKKIGQAIGSEAKELGEQTLIVGADGRISSPAVMDTLINGILTTGTNVHSIGAVPTPLVYFATNTLDTQSGIAITGSHNPADYNGFKIVLRGRTLVSEDIQKLYQRVLNEDFRSGEGQLTESDIRDDYIDAIADDVIVAQPLRVVIDCGNGIAGDIAPDLLSALGCEVLPLYCEVDGSFPNHHPDPTIPANLEDLIITIRSNEADLGIALDGDGDRIVAITGDGEIVWPDQLLMLFAKDVVSRNPGSDVVYDVKCTRHLHSVISSFGGRPIICRSGHSYLKEKIQETDAVLGGELSGHVCFNERWYGFDDGLYAAARLLEIVGAQPKSLKDLMSEFPVSVSTPEIQMFVSETEKFDIIRNFNQLADFEGGTLNNIDGTRVDFSDGWGLIRASNTNPCLTLRFEADDAKSLERIKNDFRQKLKMVDESLEF